MEVGKGLACFKRSDSGERCGVEKSDEKQRGTGELLFPRFYFFALPFILHRSPLSERLEQASRGQTDAFEFTKRETLNNDKITTEFKTLMFGSPFQTTQAKVQTATIKKRNDAG